MWKFQPIQVEIENLKQRNDLRDDVIDCYCEPLNLMVHCGVDVVMEDWEPRNQ